MSNGLITRLMRPAIATLLYRSWTTTAWKLRARDSRVCMQYRGAEISAGAIEQRAACEYYRERETQKEPSMRARCVIINALIKTCYSINDFPMLADSYIFIAVILSRDPPDP